jgi:hypothetical protein
MILSRKTKRKISLQSKGNEIIDIKQAVKIQTP